MTFNVVNSFYTQGQRANQVSSFDTNMKLLMGFFYTVGRRINVDMVDFTLKWK